MPSDAIALSLDRLVQECPDWPYGQRIDEHEKGAKIHVRHEDGSLYCMGPLAGGRPGPSCRYTDAQRDYWSRNGAKLLDHGTKGADG